MIITDPDRVSEILTAVVEDPSIFDMFVTSPDELAEEIELTDEELQALRSTEALPHIQDATTRTLTVTRTRTVTGSYTHNDPSGNPVSLPYTTSTTLTTSTTVNFPDAGT